MTITINPQRSAEMTAASNATWYDPNLDLSLNRAPDRYVNIFTISKRKFTIERPPLFPLVHVPACEPGEDYRLVFRVPHPFTQQVIEAENGRVRGVLSDGWRAAIDLVNPNNITINPDWTVPENVASEIATGHGCDLSKQGLFPSWNDVPTKEELDKARAKRHAYYEGLRKQAVLLEKTKPSELATIIEGNNDFHLMADYFGIETAWHTAMGAKINCPNCGEKINEGVNFHKLGDSLCVLDWRAAVKAGVRKRDDVPEDARWWEDEEEIVKRGPGRPKAS